MWCRRGIDVMSDIFDDQVKALLQPVVIMAFWSAFLLLLMAGRRALAVKSGEMSLSFYKTRQGKEVPSHLKQADRAYENLFEIGVLFYPAVIFAIVAGMAGQMVTAAWIYLIGRIIQGVVTVTFNDVNLRFAGFAMSLGAMFYIWLQLALAVF